MYELVVLYKFITKVDKQQQSALTINYNEVPIGDWVFQVFRPDPKERLEAAKFYCDEESFFCLKNVIFDAL